MAHSAPPLTLFKKCTETKSIQKQEKKKERILLVLVFLSRLEVKTFIHE